MEGDLDPRLVVHCQALPHGSGYLLSEWQQAVWQLADVG